MDDSQISLFANFDSANMARYERVWKNNNNNSQTSPNSSTQSPNAVKSKESGGGLESSDIIADKSAAMYRFDVEYNVWTKPDCEDTEAGPNPNRTWFYFGVKGGHGRYVKFNLMNLNKQGRLFEMGMLPVFKTVPGHEKWARIYTKPTWQNLESNFMMSFIHRIPDKRDTVSYFAFCFPHSYEECQQMLEKYDHKFEHCRTLSPNKLDQDDIYYHRELLCHSLDQRRIDLITISGCNLLNFKREPRFDPDHLFPRPSIKLDEHGVIIDEHKLDRRCYSFEKKKVFVLTSRVHPGETPASFVFNGFLEFLLRKDDPRARNLRRQFVFKLIPMLNPDGVARGYYRTDQMGTNLNRVYLDPYFKYHPSIYAVKSLIIFHHINNRISKEHDGLNYDHVFKLEYDDEIIHVEPDPADVSIDNNLNNGNTGGISFASVATSSFSPAIDKDETNTTNKKSKQTSSSSTTSSPEGYESLNSTPNKKKAFINNNDLVVIDEKSKNLFHTQMQRPDTIGESISRNKALAGRINANDKWLDELERSTKSLAANNSKIKLEEIAGIQQQQQKKELNAVESIVVDNDLRIGNENSDDDDPTQPDYSMFSGAKNSPHLNDPKLSLINPLWSGVAFYMDLHGHAAKRGCFIYGNSIENELYQIENVLFAKLIAISSQHFDFEGCNFSVKNMYMRDKREGLSKEGSGRVAMYKTLGLIHSYTLECCYASGRVMNTIVPAINASTSRNSLVVSPPLHSDIPPKFLPEHYMDVGKAVAIAALDIIEMNPNTRVPNTSFGSLEAIRNWLKFYIRSRSDRGSTALSNNNNNNINNTNNNSSNINNSVNANNINNMIAMTVNSNSQTNAASLLKKTNQRFYFQQKLSKISSKSTTNASLTAANAAAASMPVDGYKNQQETAATNQTSSGGSKSTTNFTASQNNNNKLNNVRTQREKKDETQQKTTSKTHQSINSQGNNNNNITSDKTKMPDNNNGVPTSVKTSSIGLVDFSNNLFNNPAQVGNTQFSSSRNKIRHNIKFLKDLEGAGNNNSSNNNNTKRIGSPTTNVSSGSSCSNNNNTNNNQTTNGNSTITTKNNNELLSSQLRRKLSIKLDKGHMKAATAAAVAIEVENLLDSDIYLNNNTNNNSKSLTSKKDRRWYLMKDYDPTSSVKEDMSGSTIQTSNLDETINYMTPEDIQAKINSSSKSNFKHLIPLANKSTSKLNTTNNNEITDNMLFKQFNNNNKQNASKIIPMHLFANTNANASMKGDLSLKSFETTSSQHKKFLNEITMSKPKSSRASNRTSNPVSELDFRSALLETKNLYELNGLESLRNYSLNKSRINYQQQFETRADGSSPTLMFHNNNKKNHQKLLTHDISTLIAMTKVKKKK